MAAASGAFPVKAGFNQSGGGYFYVLSSIVGPAQSFTPGTGSGGATTAGSFAAASLGSGPNARLAAGNLIKDMGKTVVSSGRTFRKFQTIGPSANSASPTLGVVGGAATATDPGYATFYLEIGRDGAGYGVGSGIGGSGAVPIVRYA